MIWTKHAKQRLEQRFSPSSVEPCASCKRVAEKAGAVLGHYRMVCPHQGMVLIMDGTTVITVYGRKELFA